MKKLLLPVLALFFMASVSSCAKCVTCKNKDQWQKFCDKDSDKDDQKNAIDYYEALGWDCRASSQAY